MIESLYGKFADTTTGETLWVYQCKVCALWSSMSQAHKNDCPVPGIESEREVLKAEVEELRTTTTGELVKKYRALIDRATEIESRTGIQGLVVSQTAVRLENELERVRNISVALESELALNADIVKAAEELNETANWMGSVVVHVRVDAAQKLNDAVEAKRKALTEVGE